MDAGLTLCGPVVAGYALDLLLGDPCWLPHPIVAFGRLIAWGERGLNRGSARFWKGLLLTTTLVGGVYVACLALERATFRLHPAAGFACVTAGVFFGLANRTLIDEGRAVFRALEHDGIAAGRLRLTRIVGRDTEALDAQQVRTAVFETMAENLSDGVVAPLLWFGVGGMPAMLAYKMVNTLDSMIGHHSERHEQFGKFAARLDDVANFVPARVTAVLMAVVTGSPRALRFAWQFGSAHQSPNAGYPEAALAGAMNLRFGGPLAYGGEMIDKPWIGLAPRRIEPRDFVRVSAINHSVCFLAVAAAAIVPLLR